MKNSELIKKLEELDPDAEIICDAYNGEIETYGVLDFICEDDFKSSIYNDLYGTPGPIDERLLTKEIMNKKIIYLGSHFPIKYAFNPK